MNPKQAIPAIAKIAPPLLLGAVIFLAIKELLSDDDTEKKSEITPADIKTENPRKEAKTTVFRHIPAEIPVKPTIVPIHSANAPNFPSNVPPVANVPASVAKPVIKTVEQTPPPPTKGKFVTRGIMATVFHDGARGLTRTSAVAALKKFGFGKTAAYDALLEDGRFSAWLRFAPDGIITWTGGHGTWSDPGKEGQSGNFR